MSWSHSVAETGHFVSVAVSLACSPLSLQDVGNTLTLRMEEHSTLGQKGRRFSKV